MIGGRQTAKRERKRNQQQWKILFCYLAKNHIYSSYTSYFKTVETVVVCASCSLSEKPKTELHRMCIFVHIFSCSSFLLLSSVCSKTVRAPMRNAPNQTNRMRRTLLSYLYACICGFNHHHHRYIQIWKEENLTRFKFKRYWNYYQLATHIYVYHGNPCLWNTTKTANEPNWTEPKTIKN